MKKMLLPAMVLMLAGCAATPVVIDAPPANSQKLRFVLEDRRPPKDLKGGYLSLLATSCNYGVRRVAETVTVPGKLAALGADLQELAGDRLAGKTVVVTSYALFQNQSREMRDLAKRSSGLGTLGLAPLLGNSIVESGAGCPQSEMEGGWYPGQGSAPLYSPYVLELGLSIDGKAYSTRVVRFPESAEEANSRLPAWGKLARGMFRQAAGDVVAQLEGAATAAR